MASALFMGCADRPQWCHVGECHLNGSSATNQVSNPGAPVSPTPTPILPAPPNPGPSGPTSLRIEISASKTDGAIGGSAGADALCPGGFKALIASTDRVACTSTNCTVGGNSEHLNWVLKPNTKYVRSDGTEVFTTNANAIFVFGTAVNGITTVALADGAVAWTGMNSIWQTAQTCNGWTTNIIPNLGTTGNDDINSVSMIATLNNMCNAAQLIICVEQ
jgi:hypothetical protein